MHVADIQDEVVEREINSANILRVAAGTNGLKGGDGGHGSRTHFRVQDLGGTAMDVTKLDDADGTGVAIDLAGDTELETFTEALEFGYKTLRKKAQFDDQLPGKVLAQIEVVERDLAELAGSGQWRQRESKSGADNLREIAGRVVLNAKVLESLVKSHSFPTGK
jgi:hypothetical protein